MNSSGAGFSLHVVDIARGIPAAGLLVDFAIVSSGGRITGTTSSLATDAEGKLLFNTSGGYSILRGRYQVMLHIAAYYRSSGWRPDTSPFIESLPFLFGIDDITQHHHLPAKITPYGMSVFLTR